MSSRLDRSFIRPHALWRLALVDADVKLHHAVREHIMALNDGWQVETYASVAEAE